MTQFEPGERALIFYHGDAVWHERLVLATVDQLSGKQIICTPDGDIYVEVLATPPLCSVRRLAPHRHPPAGIARGLCHMMENGHRGRDFSAAELTLLLEDGRQLAAVERANLGLAALPVGPAMPPAPLPLAAPLLPLAFGAGAGGHRADPGLGAVPPALPTVPMGCDLVALQSVPSVSAGTVISPMLCFAAVDDRYIVGLPSGQRVCCQIMGSASIHAWADRQKAAFGIAAPPPPAPQAFGVGGAVETRSDEARVLAVRYNALGERHREFRDCIEKGSETKWDDWGISGPRTALWVARYCLENGGTPLTMHSFMAKQRQACTGRRRRHAPRSGVQSVADRGGLRPAEHRGVGQHGDFGPLDSNDAVQVERAHPRCEFFYVRG
mmetsp:Transcript_1625/g.4785  ORF Transcript_1625/g.4785 Transcript_1625/m.4785 type:complete len:382 (-) Transcript_1625:314-1459(-)